LLATYNWDNEYLSFSYNHLATMKFDNWGSNDDYSNYNRFELCYGRITCLKENHKVFQHMFISGSIGVSYNSIRYYINSDDRFFQNGSETSEIGFPLGVSLTNSFGHSMFGGLEYKYHFVLHHMGYGEISFLLMAKIF